eukprot:FR738183.1.p1 GENE.FR738183.1~~FR738183.1.p1  ORF type:complete len:121 (+),score=14.33 FR738183.1:3-365(+)
METWQYNLTTAQLPEGKPSFDFREFEYRADQLDGKLANLHPGVVDPKVLEQIEPILTIFTNTIEVLEAQNGILRFKYNGLVRNQQGMESWARSLAETHYPEFKSLEFMTSRVRDANYFRS